MLKIKNLDSIRNDHSYKFDIIFIGLTSMVLAVLLVNWYSFKTNIDSVRQLSEDYIDQLNRIVIEKTDAYLKVPSITAQHGAFFTPETMETIDDNLHLERVMLAVLQDNPEIKSFFVGNAEGQFLMQTRTSRNTFRTKVIHSQEPGSAVTYKDYSEFDGRLVISSSDDEKPYDPRVRPWYTGAKATGGKFWSEIYVFHSSQQPGITAAYPIQDADGNTLGVFGLDIQIEELSDFLYELGVGTRRVSFIMNHAGGIVAFPDPDVSLLEDTNGVLSIRHMTQLDNPVLVNAYRRHIDTGESSFIVEGVDENFIASFLNFPEGSDWAHWQIGLVVPEDDLIGNVKETNQILFYTTLVILILALAFASLLVQIKRTLNAQNTFIRNTFGRYLTEEVVHEILEDPAGMELGGEKKQVTIMMTDLRGFTSLTEKYPPEQVVSLLNMYFEVMTEVVMSHQGTIDEFIGDAMLVIFGAPKTIGIDAQRAVACGLDMLNAMEKVNARCRELGFPELQMGIGLNTDDVVVGNIGSSKRIKYGVVGKGVNMAARIESFSTSNQLLISGRTLESCGAENITVRDQFEVGAKGLKEPLTIYDIQGISGYYDVRLNVTDEVVTQYPQPLDVSFAVMQGKQVTDLVINGEITGYSDNTLRISSPEPLERFTAMKITRLSLNGQECFEDIYCKVTKVDFPVNGHYVFYVTDIPQTARTFIETVR